MLKCVVPEKTGDFKFREIKIHYCTFLVGELRPNLFRGVKYINTSFSWGMFISDLTLIAKMGEMYRFLTHGVNVTAETD